MSAVCSIGQVTRILRTRCSRNSSYVWLLPACSGRGLFAKQAPFELARGNRLKPAVREIDVNNPAQRMAFLEGFAQGFYRGKRPPVGQRHEIEVPGFIDLPYLMGRSIWIPWACRNRLNSDRTSSKNAENSGVLFGYPGMFRERLSESLPDWNTARARKPVSLLRSESYFSFRRRAYLRMPERWMRS